MKARSDHDESPLGYAHGMRNVPLKSRLEAEAKRRADNAQTGPSPTPSLLRVTLPLRLLTPIIGGGVRPMEPDRAQPVRVTALRGALRWWWRALQPDEPERSPQERLKRLRENERLLFGGVAGKGEGEKDNVPSLVRVGVVVTQAPTLVPAGYHKDIGGRLGPLPEWAIGRELGYALFPLQLPRAALMEWSAKHPGQAAPTQSVITSLEFKLSVELDRVALRARCRARLGEQATEEQVTQDADRRAASVLAALRWWLHWGGVGARTRRGFGAVGLRGAAEVKNGAGLIDAATLTKPPEAVDLPKLNNGASVPGDRPTLFGAQLLRRAPSSGINDPAAEHRLLVSALRDMRQRPGYARDPGQGNRPGETRWPEAELMKHRLADNAPGTEHRQRVPPKDRPRLCAPRAAFGLPIVMHFKDRGDGQANGEIIPVEPWRGVKTDRWASPVLMRPQQLPDGKLVSGVLILAGDAVPREAEVRGTRGQPFAARGTLGARDTILRDLQAAGGDALRAFAARLRGEHGFVELTSAGR